MPWSEFFTIMAQVLIGSVVLVIVGATVSGVIKSIRKDQ
jgi:hypothetical protein